MIKALAAAEGNELPGEEHGSDREEEEDWGKGRRKRARREMTKVVFEIKVG